MAGEAIIGTETPGVEVMPPAVGRILHEGAEAFLDAATDKRTTTALDRLAGTELRLGILVAAIVAGVLRLALRGRFRRRPAHGDPVAEGHVARQMPVGYAVGRPEWRNR
jgi:hypothetical protein